MASFRECCPTNLGEKKCFLSLQYFNHFSVNTFLYPFSGFFLISPIHFSPLRSLRSSFIFRGILWDLLSIASTAGHRFSVSDVFRFNSSDRIRRRRLANDCWNVQLVSIAALLHHDISNRLLNARLQKFAVVYRIAGSVSVSSVVRINPRWKCLFYVLQRQSRSSDVVKHVHVNEVG